MVFPQDKRLVPGGGATEIELAKQITSYGEVQQTGFLAFHLHTRLTKNHKYYFIPTYIDVY